MNPTDKEVIDALKDFGLSEKQVEFSEVDIDSLLLRQFLSSQFLKVVERLKTPVEDLQNDLKAVFKLLDRTNSGGHLIFYLLHFDLVSEVSLKDLKLLLKTRGESIEIDGLLDDINTSDGTISYDEFLHLFTFKW